MTTEVQNQSSNCDEAPRNNPEKLDSNANEMEILPSVPDDLIQDFTSFYEQFRRAQYPFDNTALAELTQACCFNLIFEPFELGSKLSASKLRERNLAVLQKKDFIGFPEAQACVLLAKCLDKREGEEGADVGLEFYELAKKSLWNPIQALVYRGLAYYGERRRIVEFFSAEGSLIYTDILVDGEYLAEAEQQLITRLSALEPEKTEAESISEYRQILLESEISVACDENSDEHVKKLESLISLYSKFPAGTYLEAEKNRISVRAEAVLLRLRIGDIDFPKVSMSERLQKSLPLWEKYYYQGLILWKNGEFDLAISEFEHAFSLNPRQNPLRYAYGILLAEKNPVKALEVLDCENSTYEIVLSHCIILLRQKRHKEAVTLFSKLDRKLIANGSLRYRWYKWKNQIQRQEYILRTALAEFSGDWSSASEFSKNAFTGKDNESLSSARQLYILTKELKSSSTHSQWELSRIEGNVKRLGYALNKLQAHGDELFFKTVANLDKASSDISGDLKKLLRCSSWVKKEKQAGSGKLLFVALELLRNGNIDDAIHAYKLSENKSFECRKTLAVLSVYFEIINDSESNELSVILDNACKEFPEFPLIHILGALGFLIAGDKEAALSCIDKAEKCGADENLCVAIRFLCSPETAMPLTDDQLKSLSIPEEVDSIFKVLNEKSTDFNIVSAFIGKHQDKWTDSCPFLPDPLIRRTIASMLQENKLSEMEEFITKVKKSGFSLPDDLKSIVLLRRILNLIMERELVKAENMLDQLELKLEKV